MLSMFDRPTRRERRIDEFVALSLSRTRFGGGYTAAEHASALDRLLDDLDLDEGERTPELVVREPRSRLMLTGAC